MPAVPSAIRAVIFDFGGVIVPGGGLGQSLGADGLLMADLEHKHGLPRGAIWDCHFQNAEWDRLKVGESTRERWQAAVRHALSAHCGPANADAILAALAAPGEPAFIDGIIDLLSSLRPPYLVGLLSNAAPGLEEQLVERYRIAHHFDDIINSATVGIAKPEPRIYALAAERLGLRPEECFFTDDVIGNVHAARAAGMSGHCFQGVAGLIDSLRAAGVRC
jgi:putative hydrolase of the HAD superfamily